MNRLVILYHGTNREAALKIVEEGFKPETYFGEHREDAIEYGGGYVCEVAFPASVKSEAGWQMVMPDRVPPECIVSLRCYIVEELHKNEVLRKQVFESNR